MIWYSQRSRIVLKLGTESFLGNFLLCDPRLWYQIHCCTTIAAGSEMPRVLHGLYRLSLVKILLPASYSLGNNTLRAIEDSSVKYIIVIACVWSFSRSQIKVAFLDSYYSAMPIGILADDCHGLHVQYSFSQRPRRESSGCSSYCEALEQT